MKRFRAIAIAIALVALGYFLRDAVNFLADLEDGKVILCSIPTPIYDAEIAIFTDSFQDVGQTLYYEVRTGGQPRIPMTFFGVIAIGDRITQDSFTLIAGKDSDLVGVAFTSNPKSILIIHDFETDESWPKAGYSERHSSTHARGQKLLSRLKEDSKSPDLSLGQA